MTSASNKAPGRDAPKPPVNPFNGTDSQWSTFIISDEDWKEANTVFMQQSSYMFDPARYRGPYPEKAKWQIFADRILKEKTFILTQEDPARKQFRGWLQKVVDKAGDIETGVCLGVGVLKRDLVKHRLISNAFVHQTAMFLALCDLFDQKHGRKIPRVFQDPRFEIEDEYVLSHLLKCTVVEHPGALEYLNDKAFVLAPYLPFPAIVDTVMQAGKHPALYIGNRIMGEDTGGVRDVVAQRYLKDYYFTRGKRIQPETYEIVRQAELFTRSYELEEFDKMYDRVIHHDHKHYFQNEYVHYRITKGEKAQKPAGVATIANPFGKQANVSESGEKVTLSSPQPPSTSSGGLVKFLSGFSRKKNEEIKPQDAPHPSPANPSPLETSFANLDIKDKEAIPRHISISEKDRNIGPHHSKRAPGPQAPQITEREERAAKGAQDTLQPGKIQLSHLSESEWTPTASHGSARNQASGNHGGTLKSPTNPRGYSHFDPSKSRQGQQPAGVGAAKPTSAQIQGWRDFAGSTNDPSRSGQSAFTLNNPVRNELSRDNNRSLRSTADAFGYSEAQMAAARLDHQVRLAERDASMPDQRFNIGRDRDEDLTRSGKRMVPRKNHQGRER